MEDGDDIDMSIDGTTSKRAVRDMSFPLWLPANQPLCASAIHVETEKSGKLKSGQPWYIPIIIFSQFPLSDAIGLCHAPIARLAN